MSNSETVWTIVCLAPLSMGFSRQEYWSGLPCPPPGDLPDPGIKPVSLTSPALAGGFFTTSAWIWANSRRQWRTEKAGVLQSMGSQSQTWLNDWTTTTTRKWMSLHRSVSEWEQGLHLPSQQSAAEQSGEGTFFKDHRFPEKGRSSQAEGRAGLAGMRYSLWGHPELGRLLTVLLGLSFSGERDKHGLCCSFLLCEPKA